MTKNFSDLNASNKWKCSIFFLIYNIIVMKSTNFIIHQTSKMVKMAQCKIPTVVKK